MGTGDNLHELDSRDRNLKNASSDTLARLRDAAAVPIAHEHQISPRVMTDLLLIREESTAVLQDQASSGIDWSWWTVILLKPDCLARERGAASTRSQSARRRRLIDNLIHTSDHAGVVARDLAIWLGPDATALLIPPDAGGPS